MSKQDNMLKCPYCGGEDTFLQDSSSSSIWVYYCEDCEESYRVAMPPDTNAFRFHRSDVELSYDYDPDEDISEDWR
ncbi:MAG: hypothetical protein ABIE70_11075 [bacterium]